jgi:hypothetical protein
MIVVDGRLRGQDVVWEFWTEPKLGPEFLPVLTLCLNAVALR